MFDLKCLRLISCLYLPRAKIKGMLLPHQVCGFVYPGCQKHCGPLPQPPGTGAGIAVSPYLAEGLTVLGLLMRVWGKAGSEEEEEGPGEGNAGGLDILQNPEAGGLREARK